MRKFGMRNFSEEPNRTRMMMNLADTVPFLACPWDKSDLQIRDNCLACEQGHRFAAYQGIPILTDQVRCEAVPANFAPCQHRSDAVDPFVNDWIINTNGNLYRGVRGNLSRHPIPAWPFLRGSSEWLVDVGCSWGRWSIGAARAGFRSIGVDLHLDALAAAVRVSRHFDVAARYIAGDVEPLPFRSGTIDIVFSYSVLQNLERKKIIGFFREVSRVLKPNGRCIVQLPNVLGLYNILKQLRRGFRDARPGTSEMRYWSRKQIREAIGEAGLRDLRIQADGFFSQNPRFSDLDLLSFPGKLVVLASCAGREAARLLPMLTRLADSIWVEARAPLGSSQVE